MSPDYARGFWAVIIVLLVILAAIAAGAGSAIGAGIAAGIAAFAGYRWGKVPS